MHMAKKTKQPVGTPANVVQFRSDLARVIAFRQAAARMGLTTAEAGKAALQLWLDRHAVPIVPIHPGGSPSDKT